MAARQIPVGFRAIRLPPRAARASAHLAHLSSPPRPPFPPSRSTELDSDKRCYPGGYFDPLGYANGDAEAVFKLKTAELKHGRLAMVGMLGVASQAAKNGLGALDALGSVGN